MDINLSGFTSTAELAKQLITLSTGILALSITFIKDILKNTNASIITWSLKVSWITYLLSITFGIWTMMALTGTIFEITCDATRKGCNPNFLNEYSFPYDTNISFPLGFQILTFLLATIFLIVFGAQTLRTKVRSEIQLDTIEKQPENTNK